MLESRLEMDQRPSAVCLLSGGLDSSLALRMILGQGIRVRAINFVTVFCRCTPTGQGCSAARRAVEGLGVELKTVFLGEEYLEVVRRPAHGYGRRLNPCLDCRILMFRRAAAYMRQVGARFLVTGEVVGERPMSQHSQALRLIEREAGLDGLIVRPLCAQHLSPSVPELLGWVDRRQLLALQGRGRRPQMRLAEELDLKDYPCPAGGCLLTDPAFARRLRDLMDYQPDFGLHDVKLLKVGRHFRLSPATKVVVGRNAAENSALAALRRPGDLLLEAVSVPGPTTLLRGAPDQQHLEIAAALTVRYGDGAGPQVVRLQGETGEVARFLTADPAGDGQCAQFRIGPPGPHGPG